LPSSVTKRFFDYSNIRRFEFEFYCDCCGKNLPPVVFKHPPELARLLRTDRDKLPERALAYAGHHIAALERANEKILGSLHKCGACGAMVCSDCAVHTESGVICRRCAEKADL